MTQAARQQESKRNKSKWWWPELVGSVAGAAAVALRGCWHGNMSWPIGVQGCSYQVCLSCGAMRLFDENTFQAYGPYLYDLDELTARARRAGSTVRHEAKSQNLAGAPRPAL
jgi:hypothetical protein